MRMMEPSGRCAFMPCHGLNDMPSSIKTERSLLHAICDGAVIRATAIYGLCSSGHATDASSIGMLSRLVQSCTLSSHSATSPSALFELKKSITASRKPLGLLVKSTLALVSCFNPSDTGTTDSLAI